MQGEEECNGVGRVGSRSRMDGVGGERGMLGEEG